MSTIVISQISLQSFVDNRTRLEVGDKVRIAVQFAELQLEGGVPQVDPATGLNVLESEAVTVNTYSGSRIPILALSNGATAHYIGGSGSSTLLFEYTVAAADKSTRPGQGLSVVAFAENDASIVSTADYTAAIQPAVIRRADVTIRATDLNGYPENNDILPPNGSLASGVAVKATDQTIIDLIPPKLTGIGSESGVYGQGDTVEFTVNFNEIVVVDASENAGLPTLSLMSAGALLPVVASYAGGSGTKSLRFRYEVAEDDPVAGGVNVSSFNFNGGQVTDLSGNVADVAIVGGQNDLSASTVITIDGANTGTGDNGGDDNDDADTTPATIENIVAVQGDGTYFSGAELTFKLKLSEAVTVDTNSGIPLLILSNGGVAIYESGSGTDELQFTYTVNASDRNAQTLKVLGVAENDATLLDAGGNATDVRITATNNLDISNQVQISAAAPYVRTIAGVDGIYIPGEEIQLTVRLSEPVSVTGEPGLRLSNGGVATYQSGAGGDTLIFNYTVPADSNVSSADLDVTGLVMGNGEIASVSSTNGVSQVLRPGIMALSNAVEIDATPPTGSIEIDAVALKKGDSATVTLTFSEPVANPFSAIEVNGGTLDPLVTDETSEPGTVWKGTFRPNQDIEIAANTLVLDNSKVMDNPPSDFGEGQDPSEWTFGNYGVGLSETQPFEVDTKSPVAEISSETLAGEGAVTNRLVTVNFGEPVYGLSEGSITVQGGRKVPGTFTELSSGVYQIVVAPVEGSGIDADKLSFGVSLLANAVTDAAGNSNVQLPSSTFTWDETAPAITSIRGTSGSYVTGDVVSLLVDFDEVVQVTTPAGGVAPSLALTNGSLAQYVSGSGSQVLRFDYVVSAGDEATDLSVLALFENDGTIHDASGNDARVAIGSSNGLSSTTSIVIDGVVPTITTMKADDGLYTSGDVIGIAVQFSEAVHVDESEGSPILALSNGAVARYVGGSETSLLHFEYTVVEGDYDAQDLDVLALAEEGSVITEFYGRAAQALEIKTSSDFGETSDGFFYVNLDDAVIDDVITFNVTGTTITTDPLVASDLSDLYNAVKAHIVDNAAGVTALGQVQIVQKEGVSYLRFDNSLQPQVDILTAELGDYVNVAVRSELNSLAYRSEVNVDSALPAIAQISANAGYYNAGDTVEIAVAWTKGVIIDTTQGVPSLEMSNGALAVYDPSQSSSTKLLFRYVVDATDTSADDLSVVGFRAGNARFTGLIAGGDAVLDQLPEQNLSLEGPLTVDVTPPEVDSLTLTVNREDAEGNAIVVALDDITGGLSAGEKVMVTVTLSEAVQQFSKGYLSVSDGVLSRFVSNEDGTVWTGTYTPYANVSATDQVIRLDQGQLQDMAGNLGSGSVNSATYSIDSDYPSVVITSDTDGVTKEAVRFVLNFSEAVAGFDPTDANHVVIEGGSLALWSVETPDNSGRPEGEYSFVVEPNADSTAPIRVYVKEGVAVDAAGNSNERSLVFVQPIDTEKAYIDLIEAPQGAYNVGDTIAFTVKFNEVVGLNLRDGISDHEMPELFLSNGQTARYVSGSGTDTWHFEYTVATVYDAQGEKVDIDRSPIRVVNVLENDTYLLDGAGNRAEVVVGPNHGLTKPVSVDTTGAQITGFDAIDGHTYLEGQVVWIKLALDEVVTVRAGLNGPVLHLDNGGTATYMAGSGSKNLMFRYQVKEGDAVSTDLGVLSLAMGSGAIIDTAGNAMAAVVTDFGSNLSDSRDVAVDTQAPLLEWVDLVEDRSADTDVINDGYYKAGTTVAFDVSFDDAVYVDTTNGVPTLTLNNGEMATFVDYAGSSESAAQILATITEAGDANTLAEQTLALAGAVVGGDFMPTAGKIRLGFAGTEVSVRVFEGDSLADALAALQSDANYAALPFNLTVNADGDALIATWKQDQADPVTEAITIDRSFGNEVLRFEYTVGQDDLNRSFLEVVGLSENGGTIRDVSGNNALVEVFDTNLRYDLAVVDTKALQLEASSDSFIENTDGLDVVRDLQTLSVTFGFDQIVDLLLTIDANFDPTDAAAVRQMVADNQAEILSFFSVTLESVDSDIHVRVDDSGNLLTDPAAGIVLDNFRYVEDANGVIDATQFTVDVAIPDRTYADLRVSVDTSHIADLAQNSPAHEVSHVQRVDTQTVELITTPAAGLFIGSTSTVRVKDLNGDLLASEVQLDPVTGQGRVSIMPSEQYPGGYRGPVLIEVIDTDPAPDYIDEFTGEAVTLSDGTTAYVMRALLNVAEPGEIDVTVSPVTELAVTKLEEAMSAAGTTAFDSQQVADYNAGIGKIFGIDDIVRTPATVVNSALVESQTGADVTNFDATDGIDAGEKYGQVLAMLSARDSQSGSLAATITELAAEIKALEAGGQTTLAIKQAGADKLAQALDSSSAETDLDGAGVNRTLLDVAYIDEASAAGYGLNLAEAESTSVPVKGAQVGDTVFVQWGVITQPGTGEVAGSPNRFEVVIDASHVQADGSIRVPVPLSVIEKQGDATEVAVSTAVIPAGSVDDDGNAITTPAESDYRAPVLLTVDIIPPQTTVEPPTNATPFVTAGAVEGIRGGDDVNVLLNNSTDEHFKYALSTAFLDLYPDAYDDAYAALEASRPGSTAAELAELADAAALNALADVIPTGLTVSNLVQNPASGTWSFDWSLDLTEAISVAEQSAEAAAIEAGESYTPVATFTANDERSVFQVQASTADLVGNADADDARNEVIIGSVDDIVDSAEEQSAMDEALNRLSARYGDAAVDTRAEIKTVADAINGITALKNSGDPAATAGDLTSAVQTLVLGSGGAAGTPGAVAAGVHTLSIGDETFAVDLSDTASPTLADVIAEITGSSGYADLPYTVALDTSGNGVDISWKAFGPQPAAASSVAVTSTESADQLTSTISNPGSLAAFAVQAIAVDGETVDGSFVPSTGDITVGFGGTELSVTVAEGESLADALAGLQGDGDYASLPFRLTINEAGDGLVATWKATQADPVTALITVDRDFDVTTTTEIAATIVAAGSAGVTTQELAALDIQNVDDSELAAINRALASDLASASAPVVSFADSALVAGESTTVSMTFTTRVGQIPDDVMALVGGELSSAGEAGDPIWSTTDGLTWTATFTASSDMPNTALQYAERVDEDGVVVVDANGNAVLDAVVVDATTTPVTYGQAGDDLSQIALTEALVNRVTDAAAKVAAFADSQGDVPVASPSVQDFADMAVSGVRADNLSAVQDALGAIRDRFEGTGDLYTQIQTVTDSYNTVFDTVYTPGATDQPSAADLVEDLSNLGVGNLSDNSARAEDQMTLLQGALRAVAAAKADITNEDSSVTTAAEQQAGMINSVEKLERFVASVEKVLARANGETVDVDGTPTPVAVSEDDLSALGFESLLADTDDNSRLSSLQKVIADQSEGSGSDSIVAYADLKAVLETAAAAFDDIVGLTAAAQTTYVDDDARTQALTAALAEVDADNFQEMGIDGVTDVAIGTLTAAAMADAVKDALSNTGNAINSLESIQQVVDSYRQVLSVASGDVSGDQALISTDQLSDLGVSLSEDDAQEPASLATLLSGVIANKAAPTNGASTDNVNSVAAIQALADAAKRVFDNANQSADDGGANASQADLNVLGFDAVDADNVDAIQRVLTRTASRDGVTSYSDLKAKVDAAVDAHAALTAVVTTAQGSATPDLTGLDEDTFSDMGIDGVDAGNYAAMLDALSNTGNTVDTALAVQTVVDSYNVLLELGAYSSDSEAMQPAPATATDLTNIGISLQSGTEDAVAELATGIMASLAEADVDTVDEAQAIVDAIDSVFANTLRTSDDDATHTTVVSKDELLTLGFSGATDENLDAIQRVLSDQTGEADVKDYADLKALVENAITAHSDILAAATTDDLTGIDDADYAAMGIDGVDAGNLASINDALINSPNTLSTAASVQAVVDSYNHILDLRDGDANGGNSSITLDVDDFTDLGVTLKAAGAEQDQQVAYLQELVANNGGPSVTSVADIQKLADATSDLIDLIKGNSPDSDSTYGLTIDQWALLGITTDADEVDTLNARLALTADDLSEVANLTTALADRVQESRDSLGVITYFANNDGVDPAASQSSTVDFFVADRPPYTSGGGATIDFDPEFFVRFDNINVGDQVAVTFNDGSSNITVTDTYRGDGTDGSKLRFVADLLFKPEFAAIKTDSLLGWGSYSTQPYDQHYVNDIGFQTIEPAGSQWVKFILNISDGNASNAQIAGYDVSNWSGTILPEGIQPFELPSVQDYNFIGVTEYSFTETIGGSGWNVSNGTDANGDLLSRLTGSSSVTFFYDEDNTLIKSSGTLTKLRIVEETTDHIEFYVYGELSANINNTSTAAPNGPYYGWQHLRFERDSDGVITRTLPPAEGVNGSLTQYSFLDDPAYVGITSDLSALGVQDATVTHGQGAFFGLNTGTINYLASENALYVEPVVQTSDITIDGTNLAAINELFAATGVGADAGDDPATKRSEVQYVIDQNVGRLQALTKIANYADNNGADLATYPAPDAADFAAAGVSGVADDNNIPALLVKLKSLGSSSNYAATNTATELQTFVETVAIEKIASWADSDGANGAAPILQDYLNAGLVGPFAAPATTGDAITAALVPVLNELFADAAVATDAADTASQQQGIINGAKAQIEAIAKIANYADADGAIDLDGDANTGDANGYDHLTVADFEAAGISGVADGTDQSVGTGTSVAANGYDNLNAVLAKLAENGIAFINADTVDEVQQLVTDVAVEKINAYADADGVLPLETKTISVYVDAKTSGSGNAFYLDNVEAPALELKAGTYTFDQSDTTNSGHPLSFYANADRSGSLPAGITVTRTGTPGTAGAQTVVVVDKTFSGTVYYACSTHDGMGNSAEVDLPYFTPELQDYTNAGLEDPNNSAIVADQVEAINTLFAAADTGGVSGTDTYHADDVANQQAIIDAGSAKLAAIHKLATYAQDGSGSALGVPTAADYDAAGVVGVFDANNNTNSLSNIASVNAALISDAGSYDAANSPVEIQKVASRARITDYADVNGLASDGVTALHADVVPTIADYANVGVTEIYNGTQLVAIDANNLDQVNDLMAMRYVGNPDTDGSGTVDGSDNGRIDVIDNATDADTNETNLDYAGTVDTVAEIQSAVSRALGDAADADNGTFGDRAVALNKIAAFAQAVSTLADQAAYDAYIADAANASGIPTATDYNTAGVLDLTDSTEGITSALATAINAKLYTGGATSVVNTVTELQPFVDAANEVVNKIANYANSTWEPGSNEIDYVDLVYTFDNGDFSGDPNANFRVDNAGGTTTNLDSDRTGEMVGWEVYVDQIVLGGTNDLGVVEPLNTTYTDPQMAGVDNVDARNVNADNVITNDTIAFSRDGGDVEYFGVRVINEDDNYQTTVDTQAFGPQTYDTNANNVDGQFETHNEVLELAMNIDHNSIGTKTFRGPAIVSTESISLAEGDVVSFDWRSLYINDQYDVFGYLAPVDENGNAIMDASKAITLLDQNGEAPSASGRQSSAYYAYTTDWESEVTTIAAGQEGNYKFVFVAGSWETHTDSASSGGGQVGSLFWLDNIKVTLAADNLAPFEFNGVEFDGTSVSARRNQQVFDRETDEGTGFSTNTASDAAPAVLGWKDDGTFEKEPAVLQSVRFTSSKLITANTPADGLDNSVLPKRFVVQGWDQALNDWVDIQTFSDDALTASDASIVVSGESYLQFDVSSDQAFTGFRIKAFESFDGDGVIEISELDFMAKPANQTAGALTKTDFEAIGIVGVTDDNLSAINAGLFGLPDASSVSLISGIQQHVDTVGAALEKIANFANSDGAGDADYSFTNTGSETLVPTVADFNAIGLHFYRTADGRYHEITNANIAAINEILALESIGSDSSDSPASTFEEIKSVLETDSLTARLAAIEKISGLATNGTSSVTLSDAATPTVAAGDTLILQLESVFGTETLSATYEDEGQWNGVATLLIADLTSGSDYTIAVSTAGNGVKISRADGQTFTVKALASATIGGVAETASEFALTDEASTPVTIGVDGSGALPGVSIVSGSGSQVTVADFAAAGVSAIDANNIEAAVQSYVAKANPTELDTALEISATAFPPTQTITIDSISEDAGASTSDFITSDDDGLTINATLSAALTDAQRLMYSNDNGATWSDITSSISSDTSVSYADTTIAASSTIKMQVVDALGNAAPPVSQQIIIDAVAPALTLDAVTDDSGSIQGALNSGDYTDDSSLVLTGTCEEGATVEVFNGSTSLGNATVTGTAWQFDLTTADVTTYQLSAKATDLAGNVTELPAAISVTTDFMAPSQSIVTTVETPQLNTSAWDIVPRVESLGGGEFVVTWQTQTTGATGYYSSIQVQRFGSDGQAVGDPVIIDTGIALSSYYDVTPEITAIGSSGAFVLTYTARDEAADGGDLSVYVQRFAADGSLDGVATRLEATGYTDQEDGAAKVTAFGTDGKFAVVWRGYATADLNDGKSIYVQLFDAAGVASGVALKLDGDASTDKNDKHPTIVEVGSNGDMVIAWAGVDSSNDFSIFTQKINAQGQAIGTRVKLEVPGMETGGYGIDNFPEVTALGSDGAYAVVWEGVAANNIRVRDIYAQKFNADGSVNGSPILLDGNVTDAASPAEYTDNRPQITSVGNTGAFVATWFGKDGSGTTYTTDYSVFVQLVNADGSLATQRKLDVSSYSVQYSESLDDKYPQVLEIGSSGEFVVAYTGRRVDTEYATVLQRFNADGSLNGDHVVLSRIGEPPIYVSEAENRASLRLAALDDAGAFVVVWSGYQPGTTSNFDVFIQKFNADGSRAGQVSLALANSSVGTDTDIVTDTAEQTISATLTAALGSGETLYGSTDDGVSWIDITSYLLGTNLSWTNAVLSGESAVKFKVVDLAGNTKDLGGITYSLDAVFHQIETGTSTVYTDAADPQGVDDSGANMDATPDIVVSLVDVSAGEELELWIDGALAVTHEITGSEVTSGMVTFAGVDVTSADTEGDRAVELALKVVHASETVQVDTWDYQW